MTQTTTVDKESALYAKYHPGLEALASRLGADDPESTASQVLFDCLRRLERADLSDDAAFRSYAYRALRNRVTTEHRTRSLALVELDEGDLVDSEPDHSDRIVGEEGLLTLLGSLPPAQRDVVAHRFIGGYSAAETARRLGRSPGAVRRLQHDAIRRIRFLLAAGTIVALALFLFDASEQTGEIVDNSPVAPVQVPEVGSTIRSDTTTSSPAPPTTTPPPSPAVSATLPSPAVSATLSPTNLSPTNLSPTNLSPTSTAPTTLPPTTTTPTTPPTTSTAPTTLPPTTLPSTTAAPTTVPAATAPAAISAPVGAASPTSSLPPSPVTAPVAVPKITASSLREGEQEAQPRGFTNIVTHSGLCIDIAEASDEAGAHLIQWRCHGGANQRFVWTGWGLAVAHSGMCLEATGADTHGEVTAVVQQPCTGSQSQTIDVVDDQFVFRDSGRCLDASRGDRSHGARLGLQPCNREAVQRFDQMRIGR